MFRFNNLSVKGLKRRAFLFSMALALSAPASSGLMTAYAAAPENATVMENCGAYLFTWRPVDCGNGEYFVILNGQNSIAESNVILNRGYDYAYTFDSTQTQPWGVVPDLVNVGGVWAIPENWGSLPTGTQPVLTITLVTNNGNSSARERYIHVTHLPGGVSVADLPAEVRKYVINTDGSDAGAYNNTDAAGWIDTEAGRMYLKPDGTYVTGGWLVVDDQSYYMDQNGTMLSDTVTPDGYYVNTNGERQSFMPSWVQDGERWRYVQKTGYYAANGWVEDTDGKWYYFNLGGYMEADTRTPDGYYVGTDGAWDGQPAVSSDPSASGPGMVSTSNEGWEENQGTWRYRQTDGTYVTNGWYQTSDGKWYYFGADSVMLANTATPDGYYVGADGAWDGQPASA